MQLALAVEELDDLKTWRNKLPPEELIPRIDRLVRSAFEALSTTQPDDLVESVLRGCNRGVGFADRAAGRVQLVS